MQVQRDILSRINWPDFLYKTLFSSYSACLPEWRVVASNPDSPEGKPAHSRLLYTLRGRFVLQDSRQHQQNRANKASCTDGAYGLSMVIINTKAKVHAHRVCSYESSSNSTAHRTETIGLLGEAAFARVHVSLITS